MTIAEYFQTVPRDGNGVLFALTDGLLDLDNSSCRDYPFDFLARICWRVIDTNAKRGFRDRRTLAGLMSETMTAVNAAGRRYPAPWLKIKATLAEGGLTAREACVECKPD